MDLLNKQMIIHYIKEGRQQPVYTTVIKKPFKTSFEFIDEVNKVLPATCKDGEYTVIVESRPFARLSVHDQKISVLQRRSDMTGVIYPCWSHFSSF